MIKEFYVEGRIAFHLGLMENGKENGWDIVTNIPKEILESNKQDITAHNAFCQATRSSKDKYLDGIAEIILSDANSKYFYYPISIFTNSSIMKSEVFDFLFKLTEGFVLEPGDFFSRNHLPFQHYILTQRFNQIKLFHPDAWNNLQPCNRSSFENELLNISAEKEYVDLFAANNQFYSYSEEENDYMLYFLINNERPDMILIVASG